MGKLEDLERVFEEHKGPSHKLESNQQKVGERCSALEGHVERLNKHSGMLQGQFETLQRSIEQRSSLQQQTEETQKQFQTQLSGFAVQLQEAQVANERRSQRLQSATSELLEEAQVANERRSQQLQTATSELHARFKAEIVQWQCSHEGLSEQLPELHAASERRCSALAEQLAELHATSERRCSALTEQLAELYATSERRCSALEARAGGVCKAEVQAQEFLSDACSALETRLTAEIVQWTCSQESLAEQLADLNARSDRRCSTLEARVGGVCVPELVASMAERLHRRINTLHSLMGQKPQVCDRFSSGSPRNGCAREPSPLTSGRRRFS